MQTRSNLRTSVICSLLRLQQETHCFSGLFDRLPSDEQHPILKQVDQSSNLIRHLSDQSSSSVVLLWLQPQHY